MPERFPAIILGFADQYLKAAMASVSYLGSNDFPMQVVLTRELVPSGYLAHVALSTNQLNGTSETYGLELLSGGALSNNMDQSGCKLANFRNMLELTHGTFGVWYNILEKCHPHTQNIGEDDRIW